MSEQNPEQDPTPGAPQDEFQDPEEPTVEGVDQVEEAVAETEAVGFIGDGVENKPDYSQANPAVMNSPTQDS